MLHVVLVTLSLFALAAIARLFTRNWLHPMAFLAGASAVGVMVPVLLGPDLGTVASSLWPLSAMIAAGILGTSLGSRHRVHPRTWCLSVPTPLTAPILVARRAVVIAGMLGALYIGVVYAAYSSSFTLADIPGLAHKISVDRYTPGVQAFPWYIQFLSAFVFISPAFGGILFCTRHNRRDLLLSAGSLLPATVNALLQTTKASLGFALLFWFVGYAGMSLVLDRLGDGRKRKLAGIVIPSLALVLIINATAELLRTGSIPLISDVQNTITASRTKVYYFGHVSAFSIWLQDYLTSTWTYHLGTLTFAGPASALGISPREQGVYIEPIQFEGAKSNIYTIYRGLIEDFGVLGAAAFQFVFGVLAVRSYNQLARGSFSAVGFLGAFYSFYGFPLVSVFAYNTLVLGLLMLASYWIWFERRIRRVPTDERGA